MSESAKLDLNEILGRNPPEAPKAVQVVDDGLPPFKQLDIQLRTPPKLAPELIHGILRCGQKAMISGPSKAGKTFLLMELSIAIATGGKWLGFQCEKGKVLYINFEIAEPSFFNRYVEMLKALEIAPKAVSNLSVWNIRGLNITLDKLVKGLNRRLNDGEYAAIIVDPIYKIQSGDENSAQAISDFCNQIDAICTATGSAVIYCHHQSKGNQAHKNAIDRASGSGVFARDADAIIDLLPLEPEHGQVTIEVHGYPFQVDFVLREFKSPETSKIWYKYPLHILDTKHLLDNARPISNLSKSSKRVKKQIEDVFDSCKDDSGKATITALVEALGCTDRTVRNRVKESNGKYICENGLVRLAD